MHPYENCPNGHMLLELMPVSSQKCPTPELIMGQAEVPTREIDESTVERMHLRIAHLPKSGLLRITRSSGHHADGKW